MMHNFCIVNNRFKSNDMFIASRWDIFYGEILAEIVGFSRRNNSSRKAVNSALHAWIIEGNNYESMVKIVKKNPTLIRFM